MMPLQSLKVSLADRSYPIHVGRGLSEMLRDRILTDQEEGRRLAVITDANVSRKQRAFLRRSFGNLPELVLPAGESTKAFRHLETCCQFLAEVGLDRGGRVFAVGGGVIGDLAGFASAAYFRGIGFYQVPTTVLAMVDSSVGGKTGINLESGKNLVGAFHQPLAVFADLDTLISLPDAEFSAGMAEVIKHGLLADRALFEDLEAGEPLTATSDRLAPVIHRNCSIKAAVVSADEREESTKGGRALLNLGHTFGHAIEAVAGYGCYLHGEAVAIGLVLACRLSERLGLIDGAIAERVGAVLDTYTLPRQLRQPLEVDDLIRAASKDKKSRAGKLRYIALESVGQAVTVEGVDDDLIRDLWRTVGADDA